MVNATLINKEQPDDCIPIAQFPATIGRGEDVELRIDDRWISRKHCEIDQHDDHFVVRDLGSRHVNGEPVDECELSPGDEINIGLTRLETHFDVQLKDWDWNGD